MIHQPQYIRQLIRKRFNGTASVQERQLLLIALDLYETEELADLSDGLPVDGIINGSNEDFNWKPSATAIIQRAKEAKRTSWKSRLRALIMLLFIMLLIVVIVIQSVIPAAGNCDNPTGHTNNGSPGKNECLLTHPDGTVTQLTKGLSLIRGSKDDELTTPAGSQYRLILPDSTMVTMNAQSFIRFSSDTATHLNLEGEIFIELKGDHPIPYYIKTRDMVINLRSGSININTFNTATTCTLFRGSAVVVTCAESLAMQAGDQLTAMIPLTIHKDEGRQTFSWLTPERLYQMVPTREFVGSIARWYDLVITNPARIPTGFFSGSVCYQASLNDVLNQMRLSGLKFTREGRRLTFGN